MEPNPKNVAAKQTVLETTTGRQRMMDDPIQLDWTALGKLIPLCLEFAKQSKGGSDASASAGKNAAGNPDGAENGVTNNDAAQSNNPAPPTIHDLASAAGKVFGVEDIDAFVSEHFKNAVTDGINYAFDDKDAKALVPVFMKSCKPVMDLIIEFSKGGTSSKDLVAAIDKVRLANLSELQSALQASLHIPDEAANALAGQFGNYLVSIYCFAAAFKIYKRAADDANAAHERRIEAERLANEAIAHLQAQREEMNNLMSAYMLDRLLPFSEGMAAMDQAIIENDDSAFVEANAELWKLFGRETQYSTPDEFDALMMSDEAFKL